MKDNFLTIGITTLTSEDRLKELVGQEARPGKMCEMMPGFIHEDELGSIASHLGITVDQLKENLLREIDAYGKKLYKPKHEKLEKRDGNSIVGAVYEAPYGKCVFHDCESNEHKCKIDRVKPLHCRLATDKGFSDMIHSWYMLNYGMDNENPEAIRKWAIYLKTHPTIPGGELYELVKDHGKLQKMMNHENDYDFERLNKILKNEE